jgi:hypothetical protein
MPLRLMRLCNPFVRAVLRSPAHRLLSGVLLILEYTARRSGRRVAIPVMYARDGDAIIVVAAVPARKRWWRTFRPEAPATLWVRRLPHAVVGHLLDGEAREQALTAYVERFPRAARPLGVATEGADGAAEAAVVAFRAA